MDSAEPKKMTNKNTKSLAEMWTKSPIHLQNNHKGNVKSHTPVCHNPTNWKIQVRWLHASCCSHDITECRPPHLYQELAVMVHSGYCSSDHALCIYVVDCRIWCTAIVFVCPPAQEEESQPLHRNMLHDDIVDMFLHFWCNLETIQWVPSSIPKMVKQKGRLCEILLQPSV
jgi:hypothetical protein